MAPARLRWLWRFPGGPRAAASVAVACSGVATVVTGVGVQGAALQAVGWPLLLGLLVGLAGVMPWAFPSPYQRPAPAVVGLFAYFFGLFPLLGVLIFGPDPGFGKAMVSGGFFAVWMTLFFVLATWWARRRGWVTYAPPKGDEL